MAGLCSVSCSAPRADGWATPLRDDDDGSEHNVRNAVGAVAAANARASPRTRRARRSPSFAGSSAPRACGRGARRLRYDDFATIHRGAGNAGRATCGRQRRGLIAVFEPRSYTSRTRVFQE